MCNTVLKASCGPVLPGTQTGYPSAYPLTCSDGALLALSTLPCLVTDSAQRCGDTETGQREGIRDVLIAMSKAMQKAQVRGRVLLGAFAPACLLTCAHVPLLRVCSPLATSHSHVAANSPMTFSYWRKAARAWPTDCVKRSVHQRLRG